MTEGNDCCLKSDHLSAPYYLELWIIQVQRLSNSHGAEFQIYVTNPSDTSGDNDVIRMFDTTDYNEALDLYQNLLLMDRLPKKVKPKEVA